MSAAGRRRAGAAGLAAVCFAVAFLAAGCGDDVGGRFGGGIELTSPNGGEVWHFGFSHAVAWRSAGVGNVRIELSRDGGATWELIALVPAAPGSYAWAVTAGASANCLVRVSDAADPGNVDSSDAPFSIGEPFADIGAGLTGVEACSLAWGDYDNDGDLDLVLAGLSSSDYTSKVYRNDAGTFTDIGAGLTGVMDCSLAWGDYDNDGDLDLALAGISTTGRVSKVYRNDGGTFTDIGAGLTGVSGSLAWGDYDNDGDLDLALAGGDGATYVSKVYRNDGGAFTDIGAGLTGVHICSVAWGDYDNDGDLDLALAGSIGVAATISKIYRNEGGTFTDIGAGLTGSYYCSLAWGDYDNDGDLDLALAGSDAGLGVATRLYHNDGGTFTDIAAGLTGVWGSLAWGDYDNDGDLDLALAGSSNSGRVSKVYRNDGGTFTDIGAGLTGVWSCSLAWGDYDNDGDLDLALAGQSSGGYISKVYRNDGGAFNTAPAAPGGLLASVAATPKPLGTVTFTDGLGTVSGAGFYAKVDAGDFVRLDADGIWCEVLSVTDTQLALTAVYSGAGGIGAGSVRKRDVTFSWAAPAVADETPEPGLSYNLRVGTTSGGNEVTSGMARSDGWRKLPARGVAQPGLSVNEWTLTLPADTYYWSVQAVDAGLAGGAWAAEETVTVP